jgi:beta-glucosidase/6-phospho-beta-glucosidase/beta-galactosidase
VWRLTIATCVPASTLSGGYEKRFGLYFVDYRTQERTAKPAVAWYKRLIKTRTLPEAL